MALKSSPTTVSKMTVFGSFCCRERLVYASVAAVRVVVFLLAQPWCGQNRVLSLLGASWRPLGLPAAWSPFGALWLLLAPPGAS